MARAAVLVLLVVLLVVLVLLVLPGSTAPQRTCQR